MIVNERIRDYIHSLEPDEEELCSRIARKAQAENIPIIKKETAAFLKTLVAAKRPGAILEVGTAVGYSALLMAGVMPGFCRITTIENQEKSMRKAREHFEEAGVGDRITAILGDAGEVLKTLEGPYDFIFMDAAKGQYIRWLADLLRVMAPGALLFSDNVLQGGSIAQSRHGVERRERTIHGRMREYLHRIKHMEELETAVIPVGDGVAVSALKCRQRKGRWHEGYGTVDAGGKPGGA